MRRWLPLLMVSAVFITARVAQLEADPPRVYPSGQTAIELVREGAAKAHEARRHGLFNTYVTKAVDTYHIWRVQSPVYVHPLSAFFRLFGVGRAQLRVFCVLWGVLGLVGLYRMGLHRSQPWASALACAIYALSFFDIQLTRGALLEPCLNAELCLVFAAGVYAARCLPALILCQIGFVAALLTKQTALFALPTLLGVSAWAHWRAWKRGVPVYQQLLVIASAVLCAGLTVRYMGSPDYWKTVVWNTGHMFRGTERYDTGPVDLVRVEEVVKRLGIGKRWIQILFYTAPLAPFALAQIGITFWRLLRRRRCDAVDVIAASWLLSALGALQLTVHSQPRFSIIVLPPVAWLAASFLTQAIGRRWLRRTAWVAAGCVLLMTDLRWQLSAVTSATYELRDAGRAMARVLDKSSVLIGSAAPYLGFDSQADIFYTRAQFNTNREAFRGLEVTHLLMSAPDATSRLVERYAPQAYKSREPVVTFKALDKRFTLYRLPKPPVTKRRHQSAAVQPGPARLPMRQRPDAVMPPPSAG